ADVVDANDGVLTLREAINSANTNSQADSITFDAKVFGTPQTITLGGTELALSETGAVNKTTITGPAAGVTISGNNASRVFRVQSDVSAELVGLTITGGQSDFGGGIYNFGKLTVSQSTLSANSARGGGGIFNAGTLTVSQSTLSANSATAA